MGISDIFPTPEVLANSDPESIGVPRPQADAIRTLAHAVRDGQISFEKVVDSNAFLTRLSEIPGTGKSTAQWVAVRNLREPDAFPSADRALGRALGLGSLSELEHRSLDWRPWRAYAAIYLWTFAGEIRRREKCEPSARKKGDPGKTDLHPRIPAAVRQHTS